MKCLGEALTEFVVFRIMSLRRKKDVNNHEYNVFPDAEK